MLGGQVGPQVWDLVKQWVPSTVHDHERKYQSELQEYLNTELNTERGLLGDGGGHSVSTERGTSFADVAVDDQVGIELKRNFTNSQKRKLRGQLEDYAENYDFVIACACGIEDSDGWREVEQKFSRENRGMMDMTEFRFIIKRREEFGVEDRDGGGDLLGGNGLF